MATPQPGNTSELQLYRVLQKANLLQYYETFIAQGGDDVQQLCEAGEEEFLEIMALVGMASKPLHVRRLQKALQEWVANPTTFQQTPASVSAGLASMTNTAPPATSSMSATPVIEQMLATMSAPVRSTSPNVPSVVGRTWSPQPQQPQFPGQSISPVNTASSTTTSLLDHVGELLSSQLQESTKHPPHSSSPQPTPVLVESQINGIADAAARLAKSLPFFEARPLNMKKQINRDIQMVMQMSDEDPTRMDLLRKYAAIYGRFDSKRKNDKPMSLHEISVNEAAAQLCRHIPNLLTRREDLFPLARQIVRSSGYQYSKGHSSSKKREREDRVQDDNDLSHRASDVVVLPSAKRPRYDWDNLFEMMNGSPNLAMAMFEKIQREERLRIISKELAQITTRQDELRQQMEAAKDGQDVEVLQQLQSRLEQITTKHLQLLNEQSEIFRKQSYDLGNTPVNLQVSDYSMEGDDSNIPSGSSSPGQPDSKDGSEFDSKYSSSQQAPVPQVPSSQASNLPKISHPSPLTQMLAAASQNSTPQKNSSESGMSNSLFDVGLHIAQQYGMADFANELKQLQETSPEDKRTSQAKDSGIISRRGDSVVDDGLKDNNNTQESENLVSADGDSTSTDRNVERTNGTSRKGIPIKVEVLNDESEKQNGD